MATAAEKKAQEKAEAEAAQDAAKDDYATTDGYGNLNDSAPADEGNLGTLSEVDADVPTEDQLVNDEGASVESDWVDADAVEDENWSYVTPDDFEDAPGIRTSDWDDKNRSWSVQSTVEDDKSIDDDDATPVAFEVPENKPGQVFSESELPDPEVMAKAGIDPVGYLSGLPVKH